MSDDEKSRDNWVRITLRLPPELHKQLLDNLGNLSLNTSIIQRLEWSFGNKPGQIYSYDDLRQSLLEELRADIEQEMREMLADFQAESWKEDFGRDDGSK